MKKVVQVSWIVPNDLREFVISIADGFSGAAECVVCLLGHDDGFGSESLYAVEPSVGDDACFEKRVGEFGVSHCAVATVRIGRSTKHVLTFTTSLLPTVQLKYTRLLQ